MHRRARMITTTTNDDRESRQQTVLDKPAVRVLLQCGWGHDNILAVEGLSCDGAPRQQKRLAGDESWLTGCHGTNGRGWRPPQPGGHLMAHASTHVAGFRYR
jgi:hypothetical protein